MHVCCGWEFFWLWKKALYLQADVKQYNWKRFFLSFFFDRKGTCYTHIAASNHIKGFTANNRFANQEKHNTASFSCWICIRDQMVWFIHIEQLRVVQGKISSFYKSHSRTAFRCAFLIHIRYHPFSTPIYPIRPQWWGYVCVKRTHRPMLRVILTNSFSKNIDAYLPINPIAKWEERKIQSGISLWFH